MAHNFLLARSDNWSYKRASIPFVWKFDEKENRLPNFWEVHPLIRAMPDYICYNNNRLTYMHVKGTHRVKINDLILYCNI